jgi:cytochrome c551/c552
VYEPAGASAAIDSSSHPELSDPVENKRGIGKFTHMELSSSLDKKMADEGNHIYEVKCYSCHKLTDERLVGPGWKGVTSRRAPEWIMNFSTNTDEMLNKDPQAQAMLEICLIRMPNQNLSDDDARKVLEFMRENDGVK